MNDAVKRAEPDTTRAPTRAVPLNPSVQRALEAQDRKAAEVAAAPPPAPPDQEKELAKPLDELPKWESEHTFKLSRAVDKLNGTGTIREIRLRAPTGLDIFEVGGLPNKTRWTPDGMTVDMDMERFKKWMGRLAIDCDVPTLYRIPARDLRAMYEWLNTELNQAGN